MHWMLSGMSPRMSGGSARSVAAMISGAVCPVNGGVPVKSSYSTTPTAKMSVRESITPDWICSGAM